jgi:hypothetical protein
VGFGGVYHKAIFFDILKWRFPESVISHRSASELRPTETGNFFITSNYTKKITDLKGITLNVMKGNPALESDVNLGGSYVSSEWRWVLENMQVSRKKDGQSKTFPIDYIEARLEKIIIREGEEGINKFRDKTKDIAMQLGFEDEFMRLNTIISALLIRIPRKFYVRNQQKQEPQECLLMPGELNSSKYFTTS